MMMGLRLGAQPQVVATTTPRPTKLIKGIIEDPYTLVTNGSTYDNFGNLAQSFINKVIKKYEGTRLGRQELMAEMLEDNPGALWTSAMIDGARCLPHQVPKDFRRVVVGVDPAVSAGEDADETGIVVAAIDNNVRDPHIWILADYSVHRATPDEWAAAVTTAYRVHRADLIVGETNNGGDLVESIVKAKQPLINFKKVHATRGKIKRAEPIAMLYEQGRVHHVGQFDKLEDQMMDYCPGEDERHVSSPDRMDALVWACSELSELVMAGSPTPTGSGGVFTRTNWGGVGPKTAPILSGY
jgi:phage terminase large subunit-like protein